VLGLGPLDLRRFIEEHREELRPPVGNVRVFDERGFIVMIVGGPNARKDFHVDEGPELFFQLEGEIVVTVLEEGRRRDVPIREGELYLLPPRVPHCPRRPAGTVGLVVERTRQPGELDAFLWLCDACDHELSRVELSLRDITTELAPLFDAFWADRARRTCKRCGAVLELP
jgi:3-hydroxyanthranilate 3,4-dioxygenase